MLNHDPYELHVPSLEGRSFPVPLELDPLSKNRIESIWKSDGTFIGLLRSLKYASEAREHIARAAEARVNLLLNHGPYLQPDDMARYLSSDARSVSVDELGLMYESGVVLGIEDHGSVIYPVFQIHPVTGEIPKIVSAANMHFEGENHLAILSWWHIPRPSMGGASYADVIHTDKGQISIELALLK